MGNRKNKYFQYPDKDFSTSGSIGRRLLVLLLLFLALYALNLLLPRDLWVQDEARYGEVVREMIASGHWLVPHLNAHPYPDKPAPYFWLVAVVGAIVGQGALAFRIVTVLSTLAAAWGVYALAGRLGSSRYAFRAGAVFLTLTLSLMVGQIARMDMLLTAWVAFALHALVAHRDRGRTRWLVAFWLFVVLGVATKGPIALLFAALPALIWRTWVDGRAGLRALRPLAGLLALAVMVGAWMAAVWASGYGHYLSVIWNEQLVGRAVDSWSHREPVYFYLLIAPLVFMPWTPLVIGGLYRLLADRNAWRGAAAREALLISVIVVPFVAISLVSGKLFIYMQPLCPAIALIAAGRLDTLQERERMSAWVHYPPAAFLVLLGVVLVAAVVHFTWPDGLSVALAGIGVVALGLVAPVVVPRRPGAWFNGWLWHSVLFSWLFFGLATWGLNPFFSPRSLGEAVRGTTTAKTPIAVVRTTRGILNYYAARIFTEVDSGEIRAWWQAHPDGALILKTRDIDNVFDGGRVPASCGVHRTFEINFKEYHVIAEC